MGGVLRALHYILDKSDGLGVPKHSPLLITCVAYPRCDSVNAATQVFVSQRGNSSIEPILVVDAYTGKLQRRFGSDIVWSDASATPTAPTWGSHGLHVELLPAPATPTAPKCSAASGLNLGRAIHGPIPV